MLERNWRFSSISFYIIIIFEGSTDIFWIYPVCVCRSADATDVLWGGAGRAFFAYHCETCSKQLDQDKSQTRNEIAVALWH